MKIAKGTHENGLPRFVELSWYKNDIKNKILQIAYDDFSETPIQERVDSVEVIIKISDKPEVSEQKNDLGEIIVLATPANPEYTNYCNQFGDANNQAAINQYLETL